MAEFKLGRIRFVWKADWVTGTTYYKDDVINYGGRTYLCVSGHTANADFYADLDVIPTKWNLFADGQSWKGEWEQLTLYKENDLVKEIAEIEKKNTEKKIQKKISKHLNVFDKTLFWLYDKIESRLGKRVEVQFSQTINDNIIVKVYGKNHEI